MLDVSIIVVNWNTHDLLADCLNSVAATSGDLNLEIIVVDNASTDGSQAMVQQRFPHVRLIANAENVGFARANNQGLAACQGRYALLLNSDALLTTHALQAMLDLAESKPRAGIIGAHLRNRDGSFQASHSPFPNLWQEFLILSGLGGCCMDVSIPVVARRRTEVRKLWTMWKGLACWSGEPLLNKWAGWTKAISCFLKNWIGAMRCERKGGRSGISQKLV